MIYFYMIISDKNLGNRTFEKPKSNTTNLKNISKVDTVALQKEINTLEEAIKSLLSDTKNSKIKLLTEKNIIKNIGNITKDLQTILTKIDKDKSLKIYKSSIENFTKTIENIDLKQNIKNTGILYESKIFNNINEKKSTDTNLRDDLKGSLLKLKEHHDIKQDFQTKQLIEKTISHIELFQTNSLLNSMFCSYIPFLWKDLKDGSLSFGKLKNKDCSVCKIELDLEKYEQVNILLLLCQNNLSIKLDIKNQTLKKMIQNNLKSLKIKLSKIQTKTNIFFPDKKNNPFNNNKESTLSLQMDLKI